MRVFPDSTTLANDERESEWESPPHSETEAGNATTDSHVAGSDVDVDASQQEDSSNTSSH